MSASHFSPWGQPRPCWHCTYFDRIEAAGCGLCNQPNSARRVAMPARGCVFWLREPGADDEPDFVPAQARSSEPGAPVWKAREVSPVAVSVEWAP